MAITAFVARSFDARDEERIRPILNFLDTFRKAGFLCEEAPAEVESVSAKVRKMIDAKDAFVGFFTKKYPVYSFRSNLFIASVPTSATPFLLHAASCSPRSGPLRRGSCRNPGTLSAPTR